jgi:hypothetical protein
MNVSGQRPHVQVSGSWSVLGPWLQYMNCDHDALTALHQGMIVTSIQVVTYSLCPAWCCSGRAVMQVFACPMHDAAGGTYLPAKVNVSWCWIGACS